MNKPVMPIDIVGHNKRIALLLDIAKWYGSLVGDLKADNEEPTHYTSWHVLNELLDELRNRNEKGGPYSKNRP